MKYDKHTFCLHCRNVTCSVEVRCSECSEWSLDFMQKYLAHRKSLVSKGTKKPATAAPAASPSSTPVVSTVSSVVQQPALPSVSDDQKIKDYVQSFLSQFLSQSGMLSTNPSILVPSVVPHSSPPSLGATGGGGATSLNRGRPTEASGMVPPVMQEDQISPSSVLLLDLDIAII